MPRLLLVTRQKDSLSAFESTLIKHKNVHLSWATSGEKALERISEAPVDLVVSDENIGDMTGLELASKLLSVNPMVNCAVISTLSPETFHEASEGLGLIAQLPSQPGIKDAEELLSQLKDLKALLAGMDAESHRDSD